MKRAFLVRDIDSELWREFKSACAHYGMSMRGTLIKHMQNIVNDYRQYKSGFVIVDENKKERRRL